MPTPATVTITADGILKQYAADIAFVAEEDTAATDIGTLADHLDTAAGRFAEAGINGHEDVETAASYLGEAQQADDTTERDVFLRKADRLLDPIVWDMTEEYRSMVAD